MNARSIEVLNIEFPAKLEFDFCESCIEEIYDFQAKAGTTREFPFEELVVSSSGFSCCAGCASYTKTTDWAELKVEKIREDECDCVEKHGRIQHNDGGNYHYSYFRKTPITPFFEDREKTLQEMIDTPRPEIDPSNAL